MDRFTVFAPGAGDTIEIVARTTMTADLPSCLGWEDCPQGNASLLLEALGQSTSAELSNTGVVAAELALRVANGQPFDLSQRVGTRSLRAEQDSLAIRAELRLEFSGLPPGAIIVSCKGYEAQVPVAVTMTLIEQSVAPGLVQLAWRVSRGPGFEAQLERRGTDGEWIGLGLLRPDGEGTLRAVDRSVQTGQDYDYRLAWFDEGQRVAGEIVAVSVPIRLAFALRAVRPQPTHSTALVEFQLADRGVVELDLMDVAGRRVEASRMDLAPGNHQHVLGSRRLLAPGLYLIRLTQGPRTATARLIVTR